jgi:hypothetical protein
MRVLAFFITMGTKVDGTVFHSDHPDLVAARLAVLVLEATVIPRTEAAIRDLSVNGTSAPADSGLRMLVGMRKPLSCSAKVIERTLAIRCETLEAAELREVRELHSLTVRQMYRGEGVIGSTIAEARSASQRVRVVSRDREVLASPADLEAWGRDYVRPVGLSLQRREPTSDEVAAGILAVIEIENSIPIDPDDPNLLRLFYE